MSSIIIGFGDTETTGLEQTKGDQIIEIAFKVYRLDLGTHARNVVSEYEQRFLPTIGIKAKAQAVHGISMADLANEPTWEEKAKDVAAYRAQFDLTVFHNANFDSPFIAEELRRMGIDPGNTLELCTMENARWACFDGKQPRLEELCFSLGVNYDRSEAHAALYDVERTAECFFRGLDRGFYQLPARFQDG